MGLILCGGKSTNSQKGLGEWGESCYAESIASVLSEFVEESIFSVNELQFPEYLRKFQNSEIIIDSYKLEEPLAGVLSAYSAFRIFNFIAISCDMVNNVRETIGVLVQEFRKEPNHEFYILKKENQIFPGCGIYTAKGIGKIYNLYNEGQNLDSTESILESLDTRLVSISTTQKIEKT